MKRTSEKIVANIINCIILLFMKDLVFGWQEEEWQPVFKIKKQSTSNRTKKKKIEFPRITKDVQKKKKDVIFSPHPITLLLQDALQNKQLNLGGNAFLLVISIFLGGAGITGYAYQYAQAVVQDFDRILDGLNRETNALDSRLSSLEATSANFRAQTLSTFHDVFSSLDALDTKFTDAVSVLTSDLAALDTKFTNALADLDTKLSKEISDLDLKLSNSISSLASDLATLDSRLSASITNSFNTLSSSLTTTNSKVSSTCSKVRELTSISVPFPGSSSSTRAKGYADLMAAVTDPSC